MDTEEKLTLKEKVRRLPELSGVYLMKDAFGQIIYIGKAVNLKKRVSHYFASNAASRAYSPKIASLIGSICDFDFITVKNEAEAIILESKLIKRWRPRYNTLERDDKNFVLLKIETFRDLPRFTFARIAKQDGAIYYGPYLNPSALRSAINQLKKDFGIISSDAKPKKIDDDSWILYDDARAEIFKHKNVVTKDEYNCRVQNAIDFLNNQTGEIIASLEEKMNDAAQKENFESAAKFRDAIFAICETSKLRDPKADPSRSTKAVAERALVLLSKSLSMTKRAHVMECFDISHISGSFCVASMVRFEEAMPVNNKYRRFKLHTQNDDYASMREVVSRRYLRLHNENKALPDLIIIDGGKGQVHSAIDAFKDMGITPPKIIGLAKREETIICSDFEEIKLERSNEALKLLQRIRDEAHRFANAYRETLQKKKIKESILDDFEGLGKKRKEALLKRFSSISKIKSASVSELSEVEGIGTETAVKLRDFLDRISNIKDEIF